MFLLNVLNTHRKWFRKVVIYSWVFFISFLLLFPLYIYSVKIDLLGLFGGMPSVRAIENPENDLSSEVVTSDGVSLGRYYSVDRIPVHYDELSEEFVNTLLAAEDVRFRAHSGLDLRAFLRVIKGILTFNPQGGGSTITQQLAKNLFTQNEEMGLDGKLSNVPYLSRMIQKTKEWIISIQFETNYTKDEIIAMYLTTAPFSSNTYGIKVAAQTYFDRSVDELDYFESAVLVGMLPSPYNFDPRIFPEKARRKRNNVLFDLLKNEKIDRSTYDSLILLETDISRFQVRSHRTGIATHLRELLRLELNTWANQNNYDLFEDGLKIYLTIDSRMQTYAEESVKDRMKVLQESFFKSWNGQDPWRTEDNKPDKTFLDRRIQSTPYYQYLKEKYADHPDSIEIDLNLPRRMRVFTWNGAVDTLFSPMDSLKYYKQILQVGFMAQDPRTGEVKVWVGGADQSFFQYDHVRQGKRQPGSTFKPFVYGTALMNGYKPCDIKKAITPKIMVNGKIWSPLEANGREASGESLTLRQAMARSVNAVTATLIDDLKPSNVAAFARAAGVESDLQEVHSLALGTSDASVYEMVGAYSTFANHGLHIKPYYLARIEDRFGNVIHQTIPESKDGINEVTAYAMLYMLRGGVEEARGTSVGLDPRLKEGNEIGAKTGTTNDASDGWFMGITHNLAAGGWVGGDERAIRFRNWGSGSGGRTVLPIWNDFMLKVYQDSTLSITKGSFERPRADLNFLEDCKEYENIKPGWLPDGN